MLMLAVTLVITAAVLAKVAGHVGQMRAADFGSMSHQWIAAHNAAQHSSSL